MERVERLVCLAVLALVAACGGDETSPEDDATTDAVEADAGSGDATTTDDASPDDQPPPGVTSLDGFNAETHALLLIVYGYTSGEVATVFADGEPVGWVSPEHRVVGPYLVPRTAQILQVATGRVEAPTEPARCTSEFVPFTDLHQIVLTDADSTGCLGVSVYITANDDPSVTAVTVDAWYVGTQRIYFGWTDDGSTIRNLRPHDPSGYTTLTGAGGSIPNTARVDGRVTFGLNVGGGYDGPASHTATIDVAEDGTTSLMLLGPAASPDDMFLVGLHLASVLPSVTIAAFEPVAR